MVASIQEITDSVEVRYSKINNLITNFSEDELNHQRLKNKRSIAEMMIHIFRGDSAPLFFKRFFYGTLNKFFKLVDKSCEQPLSTISYEWNTDSGKPRKSKLIKKEKLSKLSKEAYEILKRNLEKAEKKHIRVLHYTERHANLHMRQIEILAQQN